MTFLLACTLLLQASGVTDKEAEAAVATFRKDWKTPDVSKRAAAATTLAQIEHVKVAAALAPVAARDEVAVRTAIYEGLGNWKTCKPQASQVLLAGVKSEFNDGNLGQDISLPALEVLLPAVVKLRVKAAVADLHKVMPTGDPKFDKLLFTTVGDLKTRDSVDPLIKIWREDEQEAGEKGGTDTRSVVNSATRAQRMQMIADRKTLIQGALQSITGQSFNTSGEASKWWVKNKGTFKDPQ